MDQFELAPRALHAAHARGPLAAPPVKDGTVPQLLSSLMASLFSSDKGASIDLSYDLRDARDWKIATIREIEYLSDLSALAIEPTCGLLAIGESHQSSCFLCETNLRRRYENGKNSCLRLSSNGPYSQSSSVFSSQVPPVCCSLVQTRLRRWVRMCWASNHWLNMPRIR